MTCFHYNSCWHTDSTTFRQRFYRPAWLSPAPGRTLRSVNFSAILPNFSRWFWREIKIRRISYTQNIGKRYRQVFSRQKEELISIQNSDSGNYKFCTFSCLDFRKIHIFLFPNLTAEPEFLPHLGPSCFF